MMMFCPSIQPLPRNPSRKARMDQSSFSGTKGRLDKMIPTRGTRFSCCASTASDEKVKPRTRTTASPLRRNGHLVWVAGGSLADLSGTLLLSDGSLVAHERRTRGPAVFGFSGRKRTGAALRGTRYRLVPSSRRPRFFVLVLLKQSRLPGR